MAKKENEATYILDSKKGLPNKLLQADGTTTDMLGNVVVNPDSAWDSKPALPNKWLNPDGTYSTLNEIIASMVDTSIYVIVDELPSEGNPQKIYLVPDGKGGFVEYHWTGSKWDPIGTIDIDLSNYSTTQEMMNAIEAAGVLTLNSAKTYTDEQIAGISANPQVFYWDGLISSAGYELWDKIVEANEVNDVLVQIKSMLTSTSYSYSVVIIKKGDLYTPSLTNQQVHCYANPVVSTSHTNSVTEIKNNGTDVLIQFTNNKVSSITLTPSYSGIIECLSTTRDYQTPYIPQYDGSPATKKYVDDCITTSITDVLNTSY